MWHEGEKTEIRSSQDVDVLGFWMQFPISQTLRNKVANEYLLLLFCFTLIILCEVRGNHRYHWKLVLQLLFCICSLGVHLRTQ